MPRRQGCHHVRSIVRTNTHREPGVAYFDMYCTYVKDSKNRWSLKIDSGGLVNHLGLVCPLHRLVLAQNIDAQAGARATYHTKDVINRPGDRQ